MGLLNDERTLYNYVIGDVNKRNDQILKAYEKSLGNIKTQIIDVNLKYLKGDIITDTFLQRIFRLNELFSQIDKEASKLRSSISGTITAGYESIYKNSYYYESYITEKELNMIGQSYSLNYPVLNPEVVAASFDPVIGDRITRVTSSFKVAVKQFVADTVIEGKTVEQLAKELLKLDDAKNFTVYEAQRIARTELLKAYSMGQEESCNQAEAAGVEFDYIWKSTLDSKTRKDHVNEDNKKALIVGGKPLFTIEGVRLSSPRVVHPDNEIDPSEQIINCRCRRINAPFGITPTKRSAKLPDGSWVDVDDNTTAKSWIAKNYPDETGIKNIDIGV